MRTFYLFIGPKIEKNMKSSKLFSVTQIFPTLLDISQSEVPSFSDSLLKPIISKNVDFPDMEFTFSETGGLQGPYPSPMKPNVFCIKNLNFKLIYYETPDEFELYNIYDDPQEKTNIFGTGLEIEEILKIKLFEWKNR